ncbi:DivIVA domain-containing protein [Amnibacterium endophyticum]|uniref:DivIVA domain-containing protein n=1 Tax=Amnibacterium endophyticum TaxID=2109337 RepID=A0ABW4LF14_9MICO
MPTTFPRERRRVGYDPEEVDRFIAAARAAYDAPGRRLSAGDIRRTAFSMRRGGYATRAVDAALERLEDAFARREREHAAASGGERQFYAETRKLAKEIIGRLERPDGRRFARVGVTRIGYSVKEVDRFAVQARSYFEDGAKVPVEQVRQVAFRAQRGGYSEAQVDLLIDGLVETMLAVR